MSIGWINFGKLDILIFGHTVRVTRSLSGMAEGQFNNSGDPKTGQLNTGNI